MKHGIAGWPLALFLALFLGLLSAGGALAAAAVQQEIRAQVRLEGHVFGGMAYYLAVRLPGSEVCLRALTPGAPMPEGAENGQITKTTSAIATGMDKSDLLSFGAMRFTAAGEYRYAVEQKAGPYAFLSYDTAAHPVLVTVEERSGRLAASVLYGDAPGEDVSTIHNRCLAGDLRLACDAPRLPEDRTYSV